MPSPPVCVWITRTRGSSVSWNASIRSLRACPLVAPVIDAAGISISFNIVTIASISGKNRQKITTFLPSGRSSMNSFSTCILSSLICLISVAPSFFRTGMNPPVICDDRSSPVKTLVALILPCSLFRIARLLADRNSSPNTAFASSGCVISSPISRFNSNSR
ncbi:MAG: hypothetical protein BWY06_02635 [Candidatus Latescibacteria bacterium ADurb.Bin168]|nr:MAG: hypothetical protein BWY06_02742 [Candidatus Latescibacteria bacterium ADurb.Bin168]OQB36904.1 MAG: hypothetical protein BWY06_02635 [Candidatus Latescibacteria bacterium ADurb.Bin168]